MKIYKKLLLILGCIVIAVILIVNIYWFPTPERFPEENFRSPILIAHAGGAIDSFIYTNSKEALENAIKNEYKFIELDLVVTNDNNIAAAHSFQDFNEFTGHTPIDSAISSVDFKNRRLFGYLHPLLSEDINKLFSMNKDVLLVTDKIRDFDLINESLDIERERMLVEVFTYTSYAEALRKGIKYPMLSIWNEELLNHYMRYIYLRKVRMIVIPHDLVYTCPDKLKKLHEKGVAIFVYAINNPSETNNKDFILKYGGKIVTGFYTDSITYKDLRYTRNSP